MTANEIAFIEAFINLKESEGIDPTIFQMMNGATNSVSSEGFVIALKAMIGKEKKSKVPAPIRWAVK
jgi:hypothetical protein